MALPPLSMLLTLGYQVVHLFPSWIPAFDAFKECSTDN